jgi:hypothetical protein
MGLFARTTEFLSAFGRLLGGLADFAGADPEFERMWHDGYEWDIIENDGKRLTLRRFGTVPFVAFGRTLFNYRCDWITHVKRTGGKVISIR